MNKIEAISGDLQPETSILVPDTTEIWMHWSFCIRHEIHIEIEILKKTFITKCNAHE